MLVRVDTRGCKVHVLCLLSGHTFVEGGNIPNDLIVGLGRDEICQVFWSNIEILNGEFTAMRYIFDAHFFALFPIEVFGTYAVMK